MSDNNETMSDNEIIKAFKEGNLDIYNKLIERHSEKAYQIAYGILRQKEDAEEVVQDSFAKMYRVLDNFRGDSQFTTWMFRIVTNYAKNRYRWNKRRGSQQKVSLNASLDDKEDGTLFIEVRSKELDPQGDSQFNELQNGVKKHFWINIILCIFFWIPGVLHALWVVLA